MSVTTITREYVNDEGEEHVIDFPAHFEVCTRCQGTGSHVNPAIDGNGLTREDFDNDPDFRDDYFAGVYDVVCEECGGRRVVPVIDRAALTAAQKEILREIETSDAEYRRDYESERFLRMAESGEYSPGGY